MDDKLVVPNYAHLPPATLRALRELAAMGCDEKTIADRLGVYTRSVRWHLENGERGREG